MFFTEKAGSSSTVTIFLRLYMFYSRKLGFLIASAMQEGIWPGKRHKKNHVHENSVQHCSERVYVTGNKINMKEEWLYPKLQLFNKEGLI